VALTAELLIARHGEAHCNVSGLVGGPQTCTGLTGRGRDQIAALASRLRAEHRSGQHIDVVYAGPRLRVQQSGNILAETLDLPLHIEPGLDGPRHGEADGSPWHQVKTAFGGPPSSRPDDPWAPGSETWHHYLRRAGMFLTHLLDRHTDQRLLIAGHGETIEAAHTLLLNLPDDACTRIGFITDHASLTRWQRHRNRFGRFAWLLAAHNDTAHLRHAVP
jgi:probable phosphoglycerate mutase